MVSEITWALLTELADFLDTVPRERFDYRTWVGSDWAGAGDLSCGTTACAAGWATTLPSFRERGLYLHANHYGGNIDGTPAVKARTGDDDEEVLYGEYAMAHVLEINGSDAQSLFIPGAFSFVLGTSAPGNNATASEVADYIRQWLETADSHCDDDDDDQDLD